MFASHIHFCKKFGLFTRALFSARNGDFVIKVQLRHFREALDPNGPTPGEFNPVNGFGVNIVEITGS